MAAAAALPPPKSAIHKYMPNHQAHRDSQTHHTCPKCGTPVLPAHGEENKRMAELEAQVRILTDKATAAADKLADYEDEVRRLRTAQNPLTRSPTSDSLAPSRPSTEQDTPARPTTSSSNTKPSRFSFLSGRGRAVSPTAPAPPLPNDAELKAALQKEQQLRQQAEGKLQSMNVEIEELSATLFSQANEMVATERKARAKLEERVAVLEHRDEEKRRRLERLEGAMRRIDRVKGLLAQ